MTRAQFVNSLHIYWLNKCSVTVECNVVFNEDDVLTVDNIAIIPGNTLGEGQKDKIIQHPKKNANCDDNAQQNVSEPDQNKANSQVNPEPPNSIPFPSKPSKPQLEPAKDQNESLQMGRGQHVVKKLPGAYKQMADTLPLLTANIAEFYLQDDNEEIGVEFPEDDDDDLTMDLPPNFGLIGIIGTEPQLLDEALHSSNAKEWQAALNYEISQLEKLRIWVIEDLPKGHTAIPCTEVLKEK
jgi:hypothetical protein